MTLMSMRNSNKFRLIVSGELFEINSEHESRRRVVAHSARDHDRLFIDVLTFLLFGRNKRRWLSVEIWIKWPFGCIKPEVVFHICTLVVKEVEKRRVRAHENFVQKAEIYVNGKLDWAATKHEICWHFYCCCSTGLIGPVSPPGDRLLGVELARRIIVIATSQKSHTKFAQKNINSTVVCYLNSLARGAYKKSTKSMDFIMDSRWD